MRISAHTEITDELMETLALYALEILEQDAVSSLEAHLLSGCPLCEEELRSLRAISISLALAAPPVEPPPELRERIRAIAESGPQVWKTWTPEASSPELQVVRHTDGCWEEVRSGVWVKRLHVDPARETVTMLIRMSPGASYVPHRHGGAEECYVLEGDLREGNLVVHSGDFQCAAKGSVHGAQTTESGCLLLIVSSTKDELIP